MRPPARWSGLACDSRSAWRRPRSSPENRPCPPSTPWSSPPGRAACVRPQAPRRDPAESGPTAGEWFPPRPRSFWGRGRSAPRSPPCGPRLPPGCKGRWPWVRPPSPRCLTLSASLEESFDGAVRMDADAFRGGRLGEPRHCHDVPRERHDEPRTGGRKDVPHLQREPRGRPELARVVAEGILRLRHADGSFAQPQPRELFERALGCRRARDPARAVDLLRDRLDLFADGTLLVIQRPALGAFPIQQPQHRFGHRDPPPPPPLPPFAPPDAHVLRGALFPHGGELRLGVGQEPVERDDDGHAELLHVAEVAAEVSGTPLHC